MFKRRKKRSGKQRILNWFWPKGGWRRLGRYLLLRLNRLKGSTRSIAAGVACGVAISFTPFVGFHFVLAAITAFLIKGNIVASALGTAAGNPWTFPFIWMSVLFTGRYMLGDSYADAGHVAFIPLFQKATHALLTFDFKDFAADVWPILWPMMVGCIPFYFAAWFISYYLVKKALDSLKNRRAKQEAAA